MMMHPGHLDNAHEPRQDGAGVERETGADRCWGGDRTTDLAGSVAARERTLSCPQGACSFFFSILDQASPQTT